MDTNPNQGAGNAPGCSVFRDLYYTEAKTERQSYDLVIPAGASGRMGLIVCIHGGGWVGGSKEGYAEDLLRAGGEKGLAAAAINYRYVSETVSFGDILDDITAALAAIREQGSACGVEFDRALLTGVSAGGHLSLLYAYSKKEAAPIRPACVVELCGPTDLEDDFYYAEDGIARVAGQEWARRVIGFGLGRPIPAGDVSPARPEMRKYSPLTYADGTAVPTVFGHGERDEIVPYANALALDQKLTACGAEHTFISFPDSGHGCEDKASMKKIMDLFFLYAEKYLRPHTDEA